MAHRKLSDAVRERCREQHHLPLGRDDLQQLLDDRRELFAEQLVRLVHDKARAPSQVRNLLGAQVEDTPGRTDEDVHGLLQA